MECRTSPASPTHTEQDSRGTTSSLLLASSTSQPICLSFSAKPGRLSCCRVPGFVIGLQELSRVSAFTFPRPFPLFPTGSRKDPAQPLALLVLGESHVSCQGDQRILHQAQFPCPVYNLPQLLLFSLWNPILYSI